MIKDIIMLRSPVKRRLVLMILTASTLSAVLVSLFISYANYNTVKIKTLADLGITTDLLVESVTGAIAFNDLERGQEALKTLHQQKIIQNVCVYDEFKQPVLQYHQKASECPSLDNINLSEAKRTEALVLREIKSADYPLGSIFVKGDLGDLNLAMRKQAVVAVLIAFLILIIVIVPIAARMQRIISKPIDDLLAKTMMLIPPDSKPGFKTGEDELVLINRTISQTIEEIDKIRALKNLIDNDQRLIPIVNRYLSLRYLLSNAKTARLATQVSKTVFEGEEFGKVEKGYIEALTINEKLNKFLEGQVASIINLADEEVSILLAKKKHLNFQDVFSEIYNAYWGIRNDIDLILMEEGAGAGGMVYEGGLRKFYEGLLLFIDEVSMPHKKYTLKVSFRRNNASVSMELNYIGKVPKELAINIESDDLERKLFYLKYYYNVLSPSMQNGLSMDFANDSLTILAIIPT